MLAVVREIDRGPVVYLDSGERFIAIDEFLGRPDWMRDGLCREPIHQRLVWVPRHGQRTTAPAVCAGCAVRGDCLAYALERGEQGIWGGTSTDQRARMRKARRKAAAA